MKPKRSQPLVSGRSLVIVFLAGFYCSEKIRGGPTSFVCTCGDSPTKRRYLQDSEEVASQDDKDDSFYVSVVVMCLVLILIFMTNVFEYVKEQMEERAGKTALPIIEKLFGEMTVLGFLSICAYFVSELGWFRAVSYHVFGEEEQLQEMYEMIDMSLSFVMILFVIQVLVLVKAAGQTADGWLQMDNLCRVEDAHAWEERRRMRGNDHLTLFKHEYPSSAALSLLPGMRDQRHQRNTDEVLFKGLREEFLLERAQEYPFAPCSSGHRVSQDFQYGRYLAICQGQLLAQVVDTTRITWGFFALANIVYFGYCQLIRHNSYIKAWTWVAVGWGFYLFIVFFERHLLGLRKCFVDRSILEDADFADMDALCNKSKPTSSGNEDESLLQVDGRSNLPMWCDVDPDYYMQQVRRRLYNLLIGGAPSRQQTLYWMDRMGPALYLQILQINLIFTGLYAALQILVFFPSVRQESESFITFGIYTAMAVAPVFLLTLGKQHLVAVLSEVCSIGSYRRPDVVTEVLREQKSVNVVRTFLVVHRMLRQKAIRRHQKAPDNKKQLHYRDSFTALEIKEVGKTFDAIDRDGGGTICYDEFKELLSSMGYASSPSELQALIESLDQDGDGEISRDEFLQWYASQLLEDDEDDSSLDEKAEFLFGLFSTDGKGEITLGEFKRKLDGLNLGFSVEDTGALVSELDEDHSGSIGLDEFKHLFHKYFPSELRERGESTPGDNPGTSDRFES